LARSTPTDYQIVADSYRTVVGGEKKRKRRRDRRPIFSRDRETIPLSQSWNALQLCEGEGRKRGGGMDRPSPISIWPGPGGRRGGKRGRRGEKSGSLYHTSLAWRTNKKKREGGERGGGTIRLAGLVLSYRNSRHSKRGKRKGKARSHFFPLRMTSLLIRQTRTA